MGSASGGERGRTGVKRLAGQRLRVALPLVAVRLDLGRRVEAFLGVLDAEQVLAEGGDHHRGRHLLDRLVLLERERASRSARFSGKYRCHRRPRQLGFRGWEAGWRPAAQGLLVVFFGGL